MAFETLHLVGIPLNGIRVSPFWLSGSFFPATLYRLLLVVTIAFRPRLPLSQRRYRNIQALLSWSSGFYPPHCYQASQALSLKYYP